MKTCSKPMAWILPLALTLMSALATLAPASAPSRFGGYDLYVNNVTSGEYTLTYEDPTQNPPETRTIGKITASDHRAKFSFSTNGEDSITITVTNIKDSNDVRTIAARRKGTDYSAEIQ